MFCDVFEGFKNGKFSLISLDLRPLTFLMEVETNTFYQSLQKWDIPGRVLTTDKIDKFNFLKSQIAVNFVLRLGFAAILTCWTLLTSTVCLSCLLLFLSIFWNWSSNVSSIICAWMKRYLYIIQPVWSAVPLLFVTCKDLLNPVLNPITTVLGTWVTDLALLS